MDYTGLLTKAIADRAAVIVVGTGASKSLSGGARYADWFGLVEEGIAYARTLGASEGWEANQRSSLEYARAENDQAALIGVASQVQTRLRAVGPQAYFDWLRESVGSLEVKDGALAKAIGALGCPLLTTNYDRLLEKALGLPTVVWDDQNQMRDLLKGSEGVGHLHGVWEKPGTVVLSDTDYQRILNSDPAQHLQSAHYSMKAFVFVGYGAGLADPNFGNMLDIHRKLFPESNHDHFRLCRTSELDALQVEHAGDSIRPIAYGDDYADLAPFLRALAPKDSSAMSKGDTVAFAAEAILDQLRSEAVLVDETTLVDDRQLDEITVPPVFLPLPHEQFASYQMRKDQERPEKRDPAELFGSEKIVVVVGDEGAGVSTALRWLVSNAARAHHRSAPLYIDARSCRSQNAALRRELTREAIARRLIDRKSDALPSYVLAIDNVKPVSTRAYESLIEDVCASTATAVFIGVRQGDESELVDSLSACARPVEVVYLGKPGKSEVRALVRMIAPATSESLADQVIKVVRRERLQRTPFNIALLIVLLARGVGTNLNSSDTAVLDKYVQLLLGRSGSFLDPRWTLDPQNREAVLAHLAKFMVQQNRGGLAKSTAIEQLEAYFRSVDWQEDAEATLETFRLMRLLRIHDGVVQFQQTAYLHLFAAKAAIDDDEFLTELLERELYYGPIIRHYAALVRQSDRVVRVLLDSLRDTWPSAEPKSKIYEVADALPAPKPASERPAPASPEPASESDASTSTANDDDAEDEWGDGDDRVPFPLDDPATWSLTQQLLSVLDLSSRVVRDSDQVANLELKDELFVTVLDRWGYLTDVMADDNMFVEVIESVVLGTSEEESGDEREKHRALLEDIRLSMPMFIALTSINATLASRKLLRTYERSDSNGSEGVSLYRDIAAAIFAFLVAEPGWAERLPRIAERYSTMWVVPNFVYGLARMAYEHQHLERADQDSVEEFFRTFFTNYHVFENGRHRRMWIGEEMERLKKERKMTRQRLQEGQRAIEGLISGFAEQEGVGDDD